MSEDNDLTKVSPMGSSLREDAARLNEGADIPSCPHWEQLKTTSYRFRFSNLVVRASELRRQEGGGNHHKSS